MVYVMLANGFEEIEALAFTDILRRADIDTFLVSTEKSKTVVGSHNIAVTADIVAKEMNYDKLDAIVLPGGMPGTLNLMASEKVEEALQFAVKNSKFIGAICAAPMILGQLGLLNGKNAICYPGYEDKLIGAEIVNERVVKDGIFITSKGAGTAHDFAACFIKCIKNDEIAEKVISSMQY